MLEFTFDQVRIFFVIALIFSILYLILYKNKGVDKTLKGYILAVKSCIMYIVFAIFIIVGYGLVIAIIAQGNNYLGIIIPIGWYIICAEGIKGCIHRDFGIMIYKKDIMGFIFGFMFGILKYLGVIMGALCFIALYDCIARNEYTIPQIIILFIIGMILSWGNIKVLKFFKDTSKNN